MATVGMLQDWEDMQGTGKEQDSLLLVDKLQMVEVQSTWNFAAPVAPYMEELRRHEFLQVSESWTTLMPPINYKYHK